MKPGAKDEYGNDDGYKGESHRAVGAQRREDGHFVLEWLSLTEVL